LNRKFLWLKRGKNAEVFPQKKKKKKKGYQGPILRPELKKKHKANKSEKQPWGHWTVGRNIVSAYKKNVKKKRKNTEEKVFPSKMKMHRWGQGRSTEET